MNRITAVEKETERPVGTSTASVPKVHRPPLDLASAPMTLVLDLLAQAQSTQVPQGKKGNYKIASLTRKARLPLTRLAQAEEIESSCSSHFTTDFAFSCTPIIITIGARGTDIFSKRPNEANCVQAGAD
ncbi:hypothetical protein N7475_003641 [Penicillium sp. IBT 31633x]|nr:hypothetical protein N7475_003641 [Penicillium sp. IBT 31633x]